MESLFLIILVIVWAFEDRISDLMKALTERIRQGTKTKEIV